jgi:hypothetical protein
MMAAAHLSKSQYIKGKQCAKALWFHHHRKDLLPETDDKTEARFESGREVGELARQLFPGGKLVDCKPWEIEKSLQMTKELIQQGVTVIYEAAALASDGAYARADILVKTDPGAWNLIEVKSSASVKDYHLDDASVQYHAFTQAGYEIDRCLLLHINSSYIRQGKLDLSALFTQVDITDQVHAQQPAIPSLVASLRILVSQAQEPQIGIGPQCSAPFDCDYQHHCWKGVPEYSIFDVLQGKKAFELAAATGSYQVKDIPAASIPKGAKAIDLRSYLDNAVHADKAKLQEFLAPLQYPLYYLDFETLGPAVPMYNGTKAYQPVPFQFSLHIEQAPDKLESKGYLHWQQTDPREEFVEQLLKQCGTSGPIIVYNKAFEAGCVAALAEVFPQHAAALLALNERMVDLLVPFKQRWLYHPKQNGSASIKAVLPAFTDKSYEELDIAEGSAASDQYMAFMLGKLADSEKEKLYSDLIAYCEMDTHAMVELMRIARSY